MRGCHDLNGRKNLNEKSGLARAGIGANKETRIGVKVSFVCKIFQSRLLEGRILAHLLDLGLILNLAS